jgi:hypothetical protein
LTGTRLHQKADAPEFVRQGTLWTANYGLGSKTIDGTSHHADPYDITAASAATPEAVAAAPGHPTDIMFHEPTFDGRRLLA